MAAIMKYPFIGLNLLILLFVGCTASFPTALLPDSGDGTPYQHDSKRQLAASQGFWEKTRKFFAPDLEDDYLPNHSINRQQFAQQNRLTESREKEKGVSSVLLDPTAYSLQSQGSGISPKPQNSLYTAFQFGVPTQNYQQNYHAVARHETDLHYSSNKKTEELNIEKKSKEIPNDLFAEAIQTKTSNMESNDASEDIEAMLQARSGDSKQFKQLLWKIRETPEEDWKIDKEELSIRLANFRNSMKAEKDSELETLYLENLCSSILSEPLAIAAKANKKSSPSELNRTKIREKELEDRFADFEDESFEEDGSRKPMQLVSKKTRASRLPDASEQSTLARSAPQPPKSRYGQLTQINDPNIVPVGYQVPSPQHFPSTGSVVPANYQYPIPGNMNSGINSNAYSGGNWDMQARIAADLLRREIEQTPSGRTFENEVRLRLLELAMGNRSEAVRPFTTEEKPFSEAWSNLMLGVSTLYDNTVIPNRRERIVSAAFRFDEASFGMSKFCPIRLKNVQFVKDWQAFGVFLERGEDCRAGEEVGVYMELENPTIRTTAQGFNVSASIRYEILDKTANIVEKSDKIPVEETTPSQKRDYCIHLPIFLPKSLEPGQYQLRINVTDMNSEKLQYTEEQIPLRVLPALVSATQQNR